MDTHTAARRYGMTFDVATPALRRALGHDAAPTRRRPAGDEPATRADLIAAIKRQFPRADMNRIIAALEGDEIEDEESPFAPEPLVDQTPAGADSQFDGDGWLTGRGASRGFLERFPDAGRLRLDSWSMVETARRRRWVGK